MKRFLRILLFILPLLVGFSPAEQGEIIEMNVEAGIGSWYRAGQWVPVQVFVQSQSVDITNGQLQIRVNNQNIGATQLETTYRVPFSIATGDSKRVFIYVSVSDYSRDVQVELIGPGGNVILTQRSNIVQLNPDDVLHAVVTDADFLDITQRSLANGRSYQVQWRLDDIPPNPDALRSLDVLLFSDVDTGQLTTDQRLAISDWVYSGGHLIITGGPNWQRTTSGLQDLLPAIPSGTRQINNINALGEFLSVSPEELATETFILNTDVFVTENSPQPGTAVLLETGSVPLIVRSFPGVGTVDFLAADPNLEPLRGWSGTHDLWRELIFSASPRPSWSYGIERFNMARDAAASIDLNLPGVVPLMGFLAAYIMLIGPINYFFLHGFRRRELAWFTIPVLIVVFTAFAYFTGFSVRGSAITVNQVNLIQVWDDYDRARVDGIIGVLSPRRTTYNLALPEHLTLRSVPNIGGSGSTTQVTITEGSTYTADDIPVDAAIMTNFATSGYIDAPRISGEASLILTGSGSDAVQVQGSVSNFMDVDLEDAVILVDDEYVSLGNLEAAETREFNLQFALDQPIRMGLGNRIEPSQPIYFRGYDSRCVMPNTLNIFYENVMRLQDFDCYSGDEEDRLIRRRALLVAAIANELDRNGGRGSGVYLVGWSDETPLAARLDMFNQIDSTSSLYIYEIPSTIVVPQENRVWVPPGLITWTQIDLGDSLVTFDANYDLSFRLGGNQAIAVRFAPLPGAVLEDVEYARFHIEANQSAIPVLVSFWNFEENTWDQYTEEEVIARQLDLTIDDQAYIGPMNVVHVRIESTAQAAYQDVLRLKLMLFGSGRKLQS